MAFTQCLPSETFVERKKPRNMKRTLLQAGIILFGASAVMLASGAFGQTITYPNCSNLTSTEFVNTELARGKGLQEPVAFDLVPEWNTTSDSVLATHIFFVERLGKVKYFDARTQQVTLAGTISVLANTSLRCCGGADDNGLMGIAVDPNYRVNRWIYVWYGPAQTDANANRRLRLSRFTITAQNTLDMNSEKILIDILTGRGEHRHAGGPMTFDAHGDLWVTLGQSGNDINYPTANSQWSPTDSGLNQEWGPSNTASLRGGIFRIHPDESATAQRRERSGNYGPGYTVPKGNFGEYWAAQFESQGKTALAQEYRDPAKVLPEVYVKGTRSPHSIGVHPTKQWLTWGDVNPPATADEINLFKNPVFGGMPYFYGNNTVVNYPNNTKNPNAPTNNSPMNSGVVELPPAMPGTMVGDPRVGNVAITGPFYVYPQWLRNRDKLPPHFHNMFFHLSFQANRLSVNTVDTNTAAITRTDRAEGLMLKRTLRSPLAARIGPDGALYILNYDGYYTTRDPGIERVSYTGSCILPLTTPPTSLHNQTPSEGRVQFRWSQRELRIDSKHQLTIRDWSGKKLLELQGNAAASYSFAELRRQYALPKGLMLVTVATDRGITTFKFAD